MDPLQLAAPQLVPPGCSLQPPGRCSRPTRPQVLAACAGHSPPGSWPSAIAVQVPTEPARLQAWQAWLQAVAQQTPSTQVALAHWRAMVQAMPFGRLLRQVPPSQKNPDWQSVCAVQVEAQESPMQTLGAQLRMLPAVQVPAALQVLAANSVEPVQRPGAHWVPAG